MNLGSQGGASNDIYSPSNGEGKLFPTGKETVGRLVWRNPNFTLLCLFLTGREATLTTTRQRSSNDPCLNLDPEARPEYKKLKIEISP